MAISRRGHAAGCAHGPGCPHDIGPAAAGIDGLGAMGRLSALRVPGMHRLRPATGAAYGRNYPTPAIPATTPEVPVVTAPAAPPALPCGDCLHKLHRQAGVLRRSIGGLLVDPGAPWVPASAVLAIIRGERP